MRMMSGARLTQLDGCQPVNGDIPLGGIEKSAYTPFYEVSFFMRQSWNRAKYDLLHGHYLM